MTPSRPSSPSTAFIELSSGRHLVGHRDHFAVPLLLPGQQVRGLVGPGVGRTLCGAGLGEFPPSRVVGLGGLGRTDGCTLEALVCHHQVGLHGRRRCASGRLRHPARPGPRSGSASPRRRPDQPPPAGPARRAGAARRQTGPAVSRRTAVARGRSPSALLHGEWRHGRGDFPIAGPDLGRLPHRPRHSEHANAHKSQRKHVPQNFLDFPACRLDELHRCNSPTRRLLSDLPGQQATGRRSQSSSTGTYDVVVVGWLERPCRSNFWPDAMPPT